MVYGTTYTAKWHAPSRPPHRRTQLRSVSPQRIRRGTPAPKPCCPQDPL